MALEVRNSTQYHDIAKPAETRAVESAAVEQANSTEHVTSAEHVAQTIVHATGDEQEREAGQEQQDNVEKQRIRSAVSRANTQMRNVRTQCEFSYHEDTKRVSIKIINRETQEVIREIPPEETLEMVSKMWELAGLMVDERR